jgi:tetratricopeptide (TPR) repeat protein
MWAPSPDDRDDLIYAGGMRAVALVSLLLLTCSVVRADDKEAIRLYNEASKAWRDADPSKPAALAEKAVDAADSKKVRLSALLLLGRVHSARTGDLDAALKAYNEIIESVSPTRPRDRAFDGLRGDALLSKGNILYAERDDLPGAMHCYTLSYDTVPSAANTDVLSQLLLRLAWPKREKDADAARAELEKALNYSKEAVHFERKGRKRPELLAKYRLQQLIVLTALGRKDAAKTARASLDESKLTNNSYYQQAQLRALEDKGGDAVAEMLNAAMKERPTLKTRNQLRNFIRSDPFFAPFRAEANWKTLVENEAEAKSD